MTSDEIINKIRNIIYYTVKKRLQDFEFEKNKDPISYKCGFDAGSLSVLLIISDCLDEIEKTEGSEDG